MLNAIAYSGPCDGLTFQVPEPVETCWLWWRFIDEAGNIQWRCDIVPHEGWTPYYIKEFNGQVVVYTSIKPSDDWGNKTIIPPLQPTKHE